MSIPEASYRSHPEKAAIVNSFLVTHSEQIWGMFQQLTADSPTGLVKLDPRYASTGIVATTVDQGEVLGASLEDTVANLSHSFEESMLASLITLHRTAPPTGEAADIIQKEHEIGRFGSSIYKILLDGEDDPKASLAIKHLTELHPLATFMARVVGTPARIFVPIPSVINTLAISSGITLTPDQLISASSMHLDHFFGLYNLPLPVAKMLMHPLKGRLLNNRLLNPASFVVQDGNPDSFTISVAPELFQEGIKGNICPFACGNDPSTEQPLKLTRSLNFTIIGIWRRSLLPLLNQ